MKRLSFAILFAAACNHSSAKTGDAAVDGHGVDALLVDAALPAPQPLVPAMLGRVLDFAYTQTTIYPIVIVGGQLKLVMCPASGCSATPTVIGDADASTSSRGRGVEIVGNKIFWLSSDTTIMMANLDGSNPQVRYAFADGRIESHLRGMNGQLYFMYFPTTYLPRVYSLDAATTASPQPVGPASTQVGYLGVIDASAGLVAAWHDVQGGTPQPIQVIDVGTSQITNVGSSKGVSAAGLAVTAHGVAYDSELSASSEAVFACPLSASCTNPPQVAPTFAIAASDGDRVFFRGRTPGNLSTIVSCDFASAIAGTCTPRVEALPATNIDLLNARAIRVDASAIYVGTDANGAGSLWRIAR
jgi:hypothetical protein